ncbi:hypothetical protein C6P45_001786 [Maudiozyma exigua]|uniref:DUF159-domain-containing protein n=1 Tax=Maudiozyma exigua TaxID=34358 RepID=A0A9P6WD76_MAUEX|nr:hypothetical protein C6P45_001786 [Kazachstania exigua]
MCGRYALSYDSNELQEAFGQWGINVNIRYDNVTNSRSTDNPDNDTNEDRTHYNRSYNVAPTNPAPVLYMRNDTEDEQYDDNADNADTDVDEVRYMRWGMVPHCSKDITKFKGYTTFNARMENILSSRLWKGCVRGKRCAIPISGYYEWLTKNHDKKNKTPYYLRRKDRKLLFLAGLFDYNESEQMFSFTIITGPAPTNLKWLHERMPCVLEYGTEQWDKWMDPKRTEWSQKEVNHVLMPKYDDILYRVYQVNKDVGKVSNKGQYLTKPIMKQDNDIIKKEDPEIKAESDLGQDHTQESSSLDDVKSSGSIADGIKREPNVKPEAEPSLKVEYSDDNKDVKPTNSKRRTITEMMRQSSHNKKPKK